MGFTCPAAERLFRVVTVVFWCNWRTGGTLGGGGKGELFSWPASYSLSLRDDAGRWGGSFLISLFSRASLFSNWVPRPLCNGRLCELVAFGVNKPKTRI